MRFSLEVKYLDDTTAKTTIITADQVAFELEFDRPITSLAGDFRLSDACWLAWCSLRRGGLEETFNQWLERVDEVSAVEDDIVPLETSQPTG